MWRTSWLLVTAPLCGVLLFVADLRAQGDESAPASAFVAQVVDGDTLKDSLGFRYRLLGIDAPETGSAGSDVATRALAFFVQGRTVRLTYDRQIKDVYGRFLVYVWLEEAITVNERLLEAGMVKLYRNNSGLKLRKRFEEAAKRGGVAQPPGLEKRAPVTAFPSLQPNAPNTQGGDGAAKTVLVYVTKSGQKYHRDTCRSLRKSRIPLALPDALSGQYTPCKRCKP